MKKGFTLIELSIVLVVIGLIVGGVLVGQDLIKGAKIRKHISQIEEFKTALNTFKLKYNGLPGDFDQGGTFWPDLSCGGGAPGFCNGNGNRTIENASESRRAWAHLSSAGLWPGSFYGGYRTTGVVPGYDMPISALQGNVGLDFVRKLLGVGSVSHNYIPSGHYVHVGTFPNDSTGNGYLQRQDNIHASVLYSIDSKVDDGKPQSGIIQTSTYCIVAGEYPVTSATHDDCYFWHLATYLGGS